MWESGYQAPEGPDEANALKSKAFRTAVALILCRSMVFLNQRSDVCLQQSLKYSTVDPKFKGDKLAKSEDSQHIWE